jgi:hypothetical protein
MTYWRRPGQALEDETVVGVRGGDEHGQGMPATVGHRMGLRAGVGGRDGPVSRLPSAVLVVHLTGS